MIFTLFRFSLELLINKIYENIFYQKNMSCLINNISRIVDAIKVDHLGIGGRELLDPLNRGAVCVESHSKIFHCKSKRIVKLALKTLSGLYAFLRLTGTLETTFSSAGLTSSELIACSQISDVPRSFCVCVAACSKALN